MPVFSKGLLCGGGSRADGKRRSGCLGVSDDEDDSLDAVCSGAPAASAASAASIAIPQLQSRNNADFEVQPGSSNGTATEDEEREDGFRFLLTLADLQLPDLLPSPADFAVVEIEGEGEPRLASETETVPTTAGLEFEHADLALEKPPLEKTTPLATTPAPTSDSGRKPLKRSAKSSCGRASSPREDESVEEDGSALVTPEVAAAPPSPEPNDEEFLILLTGLLAHDPLPPDDFRFFLTVHQAEAAT